MIVRPMAAEIASRVEALQPNVLAGIHRHRWMRQGRHIRPKKSAPFLTVAPGRQNLQNPKSRVGTSLRQPRLPRVENGPHFLGHPVVRGAAKLPLGRRVLRTDGRNLRVLVPEAPKKKRQRKSPKRCLVHHWCCFDLRVQTASRTTSPRWRFVPARPQAEGKGNFQRGCLFSTARKPFFLHLFTVKKWWFHDFHVKRFIWEQGNSFRWVWVKTLLLFAAKTAAGSSPQRCSRRCPSPTTLVSLTSLIKIGVSKRGKSLLQGEQSHAITSQSLLDKKGHTSGDKKCRLSILESSQNRQT